MMTDVTRRDPHIVFIEALVARRDWAGLVRRWMAHRHQPSLLAAVGVCKILSVERGGLWRDLARLLAAVAADPLKQRRIPYPARLRRICTPSEIATLDILFLFPIASWCERGTKLPLAWQDRFLIVGYRSAARAAEISRSLGDSALEAYFHWLMGTAFDEMHRFSDAQTQYRRVVGLCQALAKRHPEIYRPHLAIAYNSLGIVQRHLNCLPEARRSFCQAISQHDRLLGDHPTAQTAQLARCWSNLGNLEDECHRAREAVYCHKHALGLWQGLVRRRRNLYPSYLAQAYDNLGTSLRNAGMLPKALPCYRRAIALYRLLPAVQRERYRLHLAHTLNNLGNIQAESNRLPSALDYYQEAVGILRELHLQRPEVIAPELARTLSNLGNTLSTANRSEDALQAHLEAVTIYQNLGGRHRNLYRAEEARSLNNLANVQRLLGYLTAARENYQRAINLYRVLERRYPRVYESDLATTLGNLGGILSAAKQLRSARAVFDQAVNRFEGLAHSQPRVYSTELARCLSNLGNVLLDLGSARRALSAQTRAMAIYKLLAKSNPRVYRPDLARCMNNRGNAFRILGRFDEALHCYDEALRLYGSHARFYPGQHLWDQQQCWTSLGAFYRQHSVRGRSPALIEARRALRHARECGDEARRCFVGPEHRQRFQSEVNRAYELLIHTCVELAAARSDTAPLKEAVEVAEAARARNLADMLEDEALRPAHAPPALVVTYRRIRRRLRQLAGVLQTRTGAGYPANHTLVNSDVSGKKSPILTSLEARSASAETYAEFNRLRVHEQRWRKAIQTRYDPDFDPDRPIPPINCDSVQSLLPADGETAIVLYAVTMERSFAFLITPKTVQVVTLPRLGSGVVAHLAAKWHAQYHNRTWVRHMAAEKAADATTKEGGTSNSPDLRRAADQLGYQWTQEWERSLPRLLEPISRYAVQPALNNLSALGVKRIIFCPNRGLHVFPLHACRMRNGRLVADEFEVIYTPSLSVFHRCATRHRPEPKRLFLVANPTGHLRFAEMEAQAVRSWFPGKLVSNPPFVQKDEFLRLSTSSHVLHYTGHAMFALEQPLDSALILGGSHQHAQWLSLRETFTELSLHKNSLAVLNACETGMLLPDVTDDYVNFTTGFLYGGATCVISTLWSVHDLSSALLMSRFYREWRSGNSPAAALREAQRWLRHDIPDGNCLVNVVLPSFLRQMEDPVLRQQCEQSTRGYARRFPSSPPFASPAHWAAFTVAGAAHPARLRS